MMVKTGPVFVVSVLFCGILLAACQPPKEGEKLPEGAEIAFASWRGDQLGIYSLTALGVEPIINGAGQESDPVWSPDGRWLAYLLDEDRHQRLVIYDPTADVQMNTGGPLALSVKPAWSPDSRQVVFACEEEGRQSLCLAGVDGNFFNIGLGLNPEGMDGLSWAPDGSRILFHHPNSIASDLYAYVLQSSKLIKLTDYTGEDRSGVYSPDGQTIAFVSDQHSKRGIYLMHANGGEPRLWLEGDIFSGPVWSPDGDWIAFSQALDGGRRVCSAPVDGGSIECAPEDGVQPVWSPDGDSLVYESRQNGASEIYYYRLGSAEPLRLTYEKSGNFGAGWRP